MGPSRSNDPPGADDLDGDWGEDALPKVPASKPARPATPAEGADTKKKSVVRGGTMRWADRREPTSSAPPSSTSRISAPPASSPVRGGTLRFDPGERREQPVDPGERREQPVDDPPPSDRITLPPQEMTPTPEEPPPASERVSTLVSDGSSPSTPPSSSPLSQRWGQREPVVRVGQGRSIEELNASPIRGGTLSWDELVVAAKALLADKGASPSGLDDDLLDGLQIDEAIAALNAAKAATKETARAASAAKHAATQEAKDAAAKAEAARDARASSPSLEVEEASLDDGETDDGEADSSIDVGESELDEDFDEDADDARRDDEPGGER